MAKATKQKAAAKGNMDPSIIEAIAIAKGAMTKQREVPDIPAIKVSLAGRPSKYSPAILTKTLEYINSCEDIFYNYQKGFGSTDTFERKVVVNLPTKEGLALHLNVHRDTIHKWSTEHRPFSDALTLLEEKQKQMLIRGGMSGDYNPTIAKLVLSANHGMRERVDTTSDDKPLPAANVTINNINTLSDEELLKLTTGGSSGAGA